MPVTSDTNNVTFLGTSNDDKITNGFENLDGQVLTYEEIDAVAINGRTGDDEITTADGNDLVAGDMVGSEWTLVDGEWSYDSSAVEISSYGATTSFHDTITTGLGNDVLLGNGGNDILSAGAGNDIINAGLGNDRAFAGTGNDTVNLETGDDYVEAGLGDDIVNGGAGDDVIFGDLAGDNLLTNEDADATTFAALAQGSAWAMTDDQGTTQISQSAETVAGETYTISFSVAANFSGGRSTAEVDVIWNGEVIDTVQTTSGAFETFEVDVISTGEEGALSFRAVDAADNGKYNFDGPIVTYDKEISIGGSDVTVTAFAPGQSNLYQVIDGQLNVFDVENSTYTSVGDVPSFKTNSVGFNIQDDLIYGVAKSNGFDSLGTQVNTTDIVMIDANGDTYRVGEGFYGDYVGDFDNDGNLWTFHSAINRISVVDVDNLDTDGNPVIQHFKFPTNMFNHRTFDVAFDAQHNSFLAVVAPANNGGNGTVIRMDLSMIAVGGTPTFTQLEISGTLFDDTMQNGISRGAYGAVFFDGDGNLFYGLNNGDHDLNQSTGTQGAIYRVNMDWDAGEAYSEFMSEAPSTGSNDGAVDPRSADAFINIDADAAVLLRDPSLTLVEGGNDTLRGGEGNDEIHGNEGADDINGGAGNDILSGDQGNDLISSSEGNDTVYGGAGDDKLRGEAGNDLLVGNEGNDYLSGGTNNDVLIGGEGIDKIVGGTGSDVIRGGSGDDQIWGGNWSGDAEADTFVFEQNTGRDFVHDFEANHDIIDLSAFNTNMDAVLGASHDEGWATIIDLSQLDGGQAQDKIILRSVDLAALDIDNFSF